MFKPLLFYICTQCTINIKFFVCFLTSLLHVLGNYWLDRLPTSDTRRKMCEPTAEELAVLLRGAIPDERLKRGDWVQLDADDDFSVECIIRNESLVKAIVQGSPKKMLRRPLVRNAVLIINKAFGYKLSGTRCNENKLAKKWQNQSALFKPKHSIMPANAPRVCPMSLATLWQKEAVLQHHNQLGR